MEGESHLIASSFILLVAGMGMTFVFLLIQVYLTNICSKFTAKFAYLLPEPEPKKPAKKVVKPAEDASEIVAAVAAAIHHAQQRG